MKPDFKDGFTIAELVITIALLALFATGISTAVSSLNNINDRAREVSDIDMTVENKIESLRSQHFTNITTGGPVDFADELPGTVNSPRSASYTVTSVNAGLKRVDVSVTYNDRGSNKTFQYATFIGESGVGQ